MKKRQFLKLSTAALAGAAMGPLMSCKQNTMKSMEIKNWAGNLTYGASEWSEPITIAEIKESFQGTHHLRMLGTRHCFNTIADTKGMLVSSGKLNKVIAIDTENNQVIVEAGIRYGAFCKELHEAGFAVHNLASLPHISVAGACATATHGSGISNGNLGTAVSEIEIITPQGDILIASREKDEAIFGGVVAALGCLGMVTRLTLDLVPAFHVRQDVYLDLPMEQLSKHFMEIMSGGYSVSLFTDWQSDSINQVWKKSVTTPEDTTEAAPEYSGAKRADKKVHPILSISPEHCTEQLGEPGPWYDRLPHFKMEFTPSSGEELQAEYFVPIEHAVEAIQAVATLREQIAPYILISEIRTIAPDKQWMSPCYEQACVAIHFTLKQDSEGVNLLLPLIEEKLIPFKVRPHWGKLFKLPYHYLKTCYPRFDDFIALIERYDPRGKLRNAFIDLNLYGKI